jgi:RNA polymerase sigma-70 factor, ECF subfamily
MRVSARAIDDPVRSPGGDRSDEPGPDGRALADDVLLARLRAGDADAFEQVVRAWSPQMLRYARTFVATDASAQEVVQETWLGVIRGLPRFEGRSQLRTWVYSILANQARRRGVNDQRTVPMSSLPGRDDERSVDPDRFLPAGDPWAGCWRDDRAPISWGPEAQVLSGEVVVLLRAALDTLPPRQREVIVLRDVQDLSSEEVAERLGLTTGNVRVLLHRARTKVRERLEDYYLGRPPAAVGAMTGGEA